MNLSKKRSLAQKRRWRIRKKVSGSAERPRVTVRFTNKNIHAQCIDDIKGHTLVAASTNESTYKELLPNLAGAEKLGNDFGDALVKSGVTTIVFDRAGRKYHGCVKTFADSLRSKSIKF
jgi:large subunit ribosomal protein L18